MVVNTSKGYYTRRVIPAENYTISVSPLFNRYCLLCAYIVLGGRDMMYNFIEKIMPDFIKFIPG